MIGIQKGKKKGAGFKYVSSEINEKEEEDDDESALDNTKLNSSAAHRANAKARENEKIDKCLQIEPKNLNADNEMARIFGSRVVQAERHE